MLALAGDNRLRREVGAPSLRGDARVIVHSVNWDKDPGFVGLGVSSGARGETEARRRERGPMQGHPARTPSSGSPLQEQLLWAHVGGGWRGGGGRGPGIAGKSWQKLVSEVRAGLPGGFSFRPPGSEVFLYRLPSACSVGSPTSHGARPKPHRLEKMDPDVVLLTLVGMKE